MSKTMKIILIVAVIAILFGLIKGIILPKTTNEQSRDTIDDSKLDYAEKAAFNITFTQYEGNKEGNTIKKLVQIVSESNSDGDRAVSINFKGKTYSNGNVSTVSNLINTSATYNVTVKYDSQGYVETISIN